MGFILARIVYYPTGAKCTKNMEIVSVLGCLRTSVISSPTKVRQLVEFQVVLHVTQRDKNVCNCQQT